MTDSAMFFADTMYNGTHYSTIIALILIWCLIAVCIVCYVFGISPVLPKARNTRVPMYEVEQQEDREEIAELDAVLVSIASSPLSQQPFQLEHRRAR